MFERRSSIIRDGTRLSFDYVPEKLISREKQMRELERLFSPLALDGNACSAYLWGSVGAGKTASAKRFCKDMAEYFFQNNKRLSDIYINCRVRNTEYAVALELARFYDPGFPDRGFSIDEILAMVQRRIDADQSPLVVILDEVDVLLKGGSRNLVYQLTRVSEALKGKASLSLILISQYSLASMLDEASMSTFRRANMISFARYSEAELKEIVRYRAEIALEPEVLSEDAVDLIAKLSEEFGDARFALEILERAAHAAEMEGLSEISLDCIRSGSSSIYSDVSETKLNQLDMNHSLALLAACRAIKSAPSVSMTHCEKTYHIACEEYNVPAKKHTQFYTYMQDLERLNLIRTEVRREPDGGRVTYISIDNIPPKELANKIVYLLDYASRGETDLV
ncbi:MAG: AAA family ATPase [Candidatus Methanomethylophilus sp.]|nr:AAA family ATPase [Methanomethylophilus sp.]